MDASHSTEFSFHNVNVYVVKSHLFQLNYLRSALIVYVIQYAIVIKCMYNTGIFPRMLKCADVSPIYKKGNNMDFGNYRPASVLPIMSKTQRCLKR